MLCWEPKGPNPAAGGGAAVCRWLRSLIPPTLPRATLITWACGSPLPSLLAVSPPLFLPGAPPCSSPPGCSLTSLPCQHPLTDPVSPHLPSSCLIAVPLLGSAQALSNLCLSSSWLSCSSQTACHQISAAPPSTPSLPNSLLPAPTIQCLSVSIANSPTAALSSLSVFLLHCVPHLSLHLFIPRVPSPDATWMYSPMNKCMSTCQHALAHGRVMI